MKRRRYVLLLAALLLLAVQVRAQQGAASVTANGITFFKGTFGEALAKARQENKPLFVDFYAVWCVPCKKMAKNVFTQEEVGKYFNEHFISLQLDAEKGENVEIEEIYENILKRDKIDSTRKESPLKKAKDAVEVDTTSKSIEEVKNEILRMVNSNI